MTTALPPTPGQAETREAKIAEMQALGLPPAMIAAECGMTTSAIYRATRKARNGTAPDVHSERHVRIVANIAAYPSRSMFDWAGEARRHA